MTQSEISAALREARAAGDDARVAELEDRLTLLAYRWKMQQEEAVASFPAPVVPRPQRAPRAVAFLAAVLGG